MCLGIAKVYEESIPKELGYVSIKTCDDLRTDILVLTDDFSIFFGVELTGELRRIYKIAEHHGKLPAFGFRGVMVGWWRCGSRRRFLDDRLWWCLDSLSRWLRFRAAIAGPYQDAILVIHCQLLSVDEFVLQGFNAIIAQGKLHLEGSIGHPSSLLQKVDNLVAYFIEVHYRPSSNSSNNAFASFKSAVSNPSVNQP